MCVICGCSYLYNTSSQELFMLCYQRRIRTERVQDSHVPITPLCTVGGGRGGEAEGKGMSGEGRREEGEKERGEEERQIYVKKNNEARTYLERCRDAPAKIHTRSHTFPGPTCVKPSLMRLCLKVRANCSNSSRSLGSSG